MRKLKYFRNFYGTFIQATQFKGQPGSGIVVGSGTSKSYLSVGPFLCPIQSI